MEKNRDKILVGLVGGIFALLCLLVWVMPDAQYSTAERRELKQMPEFSAETIVCGRFMSNFEEYSLDQFPFRDLYRSFKALTSLKSDNNDVYVVDNVINSMDYPLKESNLAYASDRFRNIYDTYLKDRNCAIYLSIIPDKNYFYAENNGYLALDYEKLITVMREQNDYMTYLDIFEELSGEDYYNTDTHWRQECLPEVANKLLTGMGSKVVTEYEQVDATEEFYGVYYGQAALPLPPDSISYLTNPMIEGYQVFDFQNNREIPVYDESRLSGKDPYEMFIGGPISLVTITNSGCDNGKHLIVFRDSFTSSLAPLLAQGYSKTTLIDIRYILPAMLGKYVEFADADVLFLYSTMVLNNSETLK